MTSHREISERFRACGSKSSKVYKTIVGGLDRHCTLSHMMRYRGGGKYTKIPKSDVRSYREKAQRWRLHKSSTRSGRARSSPDAFQHQSQDQLQYGGSSAVMRSNVDRSITCDNMQNMTRFQTSDEGRPNQHSTQIIETMDDMEKFLASRRVSVKKNQLPTRNRNDNSYDGGVNDNDEVDYASSDNSDETGGTKLFDDRDSVEVRLSEPAYVRKTSHGTTDWNHFYNTYNDEDDDDKEDDYTREERQTKTCSKRQRFQPKTRPIKWCRY